MDLAAEFAVHRDYLVTIAYRMLGSRHEAEDVVQEAYVRAERAGGDDVVEPRAWLTRIVGRLALDQLKSARVRREQYVGPWLPEPLVQEAGGAGVADPADRVTLDDQISLALLAVLESLSPAERAVYVLHEAFGLPFDEVASIVGRTPQACRQLAVRARDHLRTRAPRFDADPDEQQRVVAGFKAAAETGDVDGLARLLDENVLLRADGGGVVRTAARPIQGRNAVTRTFAAGIRSATTLAITEALVNGQPGLVARYDGQTVVFAFVVTDGLIAQIDIVANPEKLAL
ncbi:MAG: RNA polymerase sigma factor SigJ [Acidimicrobiales bacterium]